jgi:ATP phosphoribosyltransferase regulatory subunit
MLNRTGVVRLCYCGPVLHARAAGAGATREPLQFGAEIYGHDGLAADIEILDLMLECLHVAGDRGRRRRSRRRAHRRAVLAGVPVDAARLDAVYAALAAKDAAEIRSLSAGFPAPARQGSRR